VTLRWRKPWLDQQELRGSVRCESTSGAEVVLHVRERGDALEVEVTSPQPERVRFVSGALRSDA
jgi:hypothetical protein